MVWNPEQQRLWRSLARDGAHVLLFILAVALIVKGGLLTSPADLGLVAAGTGLLGVLGLARA